MRARITRARQAMRSGDHVAFIFTSAHDKAATVADLDDGTLRLLNRAGHTHAHLRVEFNLDKAVLSIRLRALSSTYCKASSTCEVRLLSSVALSMAANFDASSF